MYRDPENHITIRILSLIKALETRGIPETMAIKLAGAICAQLYAGLAWPTWLSAAVANLSARSFIPNSGRKTQRAKILYTRAGTAVDDMNPASRHTYYTTTIIWVLVEKVMQDLYHLQY